MPARRGLAALAALVVLLTSGCRVVHEVAVDVDPDGAGTFAVHVGLDGEARSLLAGDLAALLPIDDEENGEDGAPDDELTESPWQEGDLEGVRSAFAVSDLDELAAALAGAFGTPERPDPGGIRADGDRLVFELDVKPAVEALIAGSDRRSGSEPPRGVELRFALRLPGAVVEHNADDESTDGTLRWSLLPPPAEPLRASTAGIAGEGGGEGNAGPRLPRSGWRQVLVVAGAASGLLGAVLVLRLRRCRRGDRC